MQTFERRLELPVDVTELYRWHTQPGAFERLGPPWEEVELLSRPAPIVEGAQQQMMVRVGPARMRWVSRIEEVVPDKLFRDVATESPFAHWEHTHLMESRGPGRSTLVDRIEYALPAGPIGGLLGGSAVRRRLEQAFAYRHRVTANDLARHQSVAGVKPMDVLVTGASGLVGSVLTSFLTTGGHRVRHLVRRDRENENEFRWDPATGVIDPRSVEGADAVVHLAGENIAAKRWSAVQKDRIRRSRIEGTRLVADAVRGAKQRPHTFVTASAVGWYGDRGDEWLDEESSRGTDFLAETCADWESEATRVAEVRTVPVRFGVILSPAGGALRKMLLPFKMGAGGRIGSGRQWMSWISIDDAVGALYRALVDKSLEGPVNAVSPNPVTNAEYTRTLGSVLRRPAIAPMPALAARLAFGELADALLLASQRVKPVRLSSSGFEFAYPELEGALRHLLGRDGGVPQSAPTPTAAATAAS